MQNNWFVRISAIIAILIFIWLLVSRYSGQKIETLLQRPEVLPGSPLSGQITHYQRHWLSSHFDYQVNNADNSAMLAIFQVDIQHGPLPLNRFFHFKWLPIAAQVQVHLKQLGLPLTQYIKPQNMTLAKWLNIDGIIHYSGKQEFHLHLLPWMMQIHQTGQLQAGKLDFYLNRNPNDKEAKYQLALTDLRLLEQQQPLLSLHQFHQENYLHHTTGKGNTYLDRLDMHFSPYHLSLEQISNNTDINTMANGKIQQKEYGNIGKVLLNKALLGSNQFSININGLTPAFVEKYAFLHWPFPQDNSMTELLAQHPTLQLTPLRWHQNKALSEIQLTLQLQPATAGQSLATAIVQGDLKSQLSREMLQNLAEKIAVTQGFPAQSVADFSQRLLDHLQQLLQQSHLIEVRENQWISHIHYRDDSLTINDRKINQQQLQELLR